MANVQRTRAMNLGISCYMQVLIPAVKLHV